MWLPLLLASYRDWPSARKARSKDTLRVTTCMCLLFGSTTESSRMYLRSGIMAVEGGGGPDMGPHEAYSCLAGMKLRKIHGTPPSIVRRRLECSRPQASTRRCSTSALVTKAWESYLRGMLQKDDWGRR